jgi:PAS domain-containing protein
MELNQSNEKLLIEMTERKQAQEALRESGEHFRHLIQAAPIPLSFVVNGERIDAINDRFTEIFGTIKMQSQLINRSSCSGTTLSSWLIPSESKS